jgi:hypothetical protein
VNEADYPGGVEWLCKKCQLFLKSPFSPLASGNDLGKSSGESAEADAEKGSASNAEEKTPQNQDFILNPFYLPSNKENLILAVSQGKRIEAELKEADIMKTTNIMAQGGRTMKDLYRRLVKTTQPPITKVKRVILFLGGNDLNTDNAGSMDEYLK